MWYVKTIHRFSGRANSDGYVLLCCVKSVELVNSDTKECIEVPASELKSYNPLGFVDVYSEYANRYYSARQPFLVAMSDVDCEIMRGILSTSYSVVDSYILEYVNFFPCNDDMTIWVVDSETMPTSRLLLKKLKSLDAGVLNFAVESGELPISGVDGSSGSGCVATFKISHRLAVYLQRLQLLRR